MKTEVCRKAFVKPQPGGEWATTAEDPTGYLTTRAHHNWTVEDWKNVAWSDESRFLLRHSDGRVGIWRKQNENMIYHALLPLCRLVVVV